MSRTLAGRTITAVMARKHKIQLLTLPVWTEAEDDYLREACKTYGPRFHLMALLHGGSHGEGQISNRLRRFPIVDLKHRAQMLGLLSGLDASQITLNPVDPAGGVLEAPSEISDVDHQRFINSARLAGPVFSVEEAGQSPPDLIRLMLNPYHICPRITGSVLGSDEGRVLAGLALNDATRLKMLHTIGAGGHGRRLMILGLARSSRRVLNSELPARRQVVKDAVDLYCQKFMRHAHCFRETIFFDNLQAVVPIPCVNKVSGNDVKETWRNQSRSAIVWLHTLRTLSAGDALILLLRGIEGFSVELASWIAFARSVQLDVFIAVEEQSRRPQSYHPVYLRPSPVYPTLYAHFSLTTLCAVHEGTLKYPHYVALIHQWADETFRRQNPQFSKRAGRNAPPVPCADPADFSPALVGDLSLVLGPRRCSKAQSNLRDAEITDSRRVTRAVARQMALADSGT